ncbi:MAG: molybdenum cofactor guanylyltransferase [Anaerolineales bacterium]|jgi:molybdopterin-guanine dinucleotide biosynthesis protein A
MAFSLVLLAGGRSSRMGQNKCLMELDGRALLNHILDQLGPQAAEMFIVADDPTPYLRAQLPAIGDETPGLGPLGGLATALGHAAQDHVLLTACDMPFVCLPLIERMLGYSEHADAVLPRLGGEVEPLRAVYNRVCLEPVQEALRRGERRMISFLPRVHVRYLEEAEIGEFDPERLTFFNINTPADWARAEELARSRLSDESRGRQ